MDDLIGIVIRGSVMYLYVLAIVRLSGKRTIGSVSPQDFAAATIIGDMFDDVFWAEVPLAKGIVGISTIMLIHMLLVYASFKYPAIDRFFGTGSTPLIRNGAFEQDGLRRERLRQEDVTWLMRLKGQDNLEDIRDAQLEPGDTLSVLLREEARPAQKRDLPRLKEALR